jgi:hypothetical protein
MKISVNSKNEFKFVPDIFNNLELDSKDQFVIVFKKLSALDENNYTIYNKEDGKVRIDLRERIKASIVRLENPPTLEIDDGESEVELTVDILLSGKYNALFALEDMLIMEIKKLDEETNLNVKK